MVTRTAWCIVTSLLMLEKNEDKVLDVNLKLRHALYSATIQVKQPFSSPKAIQDTMLSSGVQLRDLPKSHVGRSMSELVHGHGPLDQASSHAVVSQQVTSHHQPCSGDSQLRYVPSPLSASD